MYIDKIQVDDILYDVKDNSSGYITKSVDDLSNYELKTNTGTSISLSINSSTYVMTLQLKNSNGDTISTGTIDLPLETMVVGADYDSTNKSIILTLQSGSTVSFSVADLVSGLVSESDLNTALSALATVATSGSYTDLSNKPAIPDTTNMEITTNKTTTISSSSTDNQYPSAKAVYDYIQSLNGNGVNY